MAGRLAIDFGTCNTVVALWDAAAKEGLPLHVPGLARMERQCGEEVAVIPSVIHYGDKGGTLIANEVLAGNVYHSDLTFRWMKRYIMQRNPATQQIRGRELSHQDAGRNFLTAVLVKAAALAKLGDEEVAVTVPVEAFEHYEHWLSSVLDGVRMQRCRVIDEPSAAAMGYGLEVLSGDVYLVFDFGCGTLDVAVIIIEDDLLERRGCRCRVLGKAGAEIGGASIDQWLYEHVLVANQCTPGDEQVARVSRLLLVECERAKERLSFDVEAAISVMNPYTGSVLEASLTRSAFEDLLDRKDVFTTIGQTLRRALNTSREHGYDEEHVKAVLMVGGSSLIPSVQRSLHQFFGRQRVKLNRPMDAVARGAAAFVAGAQISNHIQHDYAIRHIDPRSGDVSHRVLVRRGTVYPTKEPVDQFAIRATSENQVRMGIEIHELGSRGELASSAPFELMFDPTGAVRLVQPSVQEMAQRATFWMNEYQPTFLTANPPAKWGDHCFNVEFGVDENKRLLITARDCRTGKLLLKNFPVVKLS